MRIIPAKMFRVNASRKVLVDDEDYEELIKHRWRLNHGGYALRMAYGGMAEGKERKIVVQMHRFITGMLNDKRKLTVDHINGDKLDNRKENLRICTIKENLRNRTVQRNSSTGLKGVYKNGKGFIARIKTDNTTSNLGTFPTKEQAKQKYNEVAKELHGKFFKE